MRATFDFLAATLVLPESRAGDPGFDAGLAAVERGCDVVATAAGRDIGFGEAVFAEAGIAEAFAEVCLAIAFPAVVFFAATFLATGFFTGAVLATAFFAVVFFATAFFSTVFFATDFFAAEFFGTDFRTSDVAPATFFASVAFTLFPGFDRLTATPAAVFDSPAALGAGCLRTGVFLAFFGVLAGFRVAIAHDLR